ncbi:MAG: cupin domain-containing protein [bacterium]|nr:cupin domain-containing protein [bacterium]
MALPRPESGEVFNIHPTGEQYTEFFTRAIVRTDELEVIRFVLPQGNTLREHKVAGDCTVQCIEGAIELTAHGKTVRLVEGEMTYIAACAQHAVLALKNSVILVTMVLHKSNHA